MNKLIIILSTLLALSFNSSAQDKWELFINKKLIKKGATASEGTVIKINPNSIKDKDQIEIKYKSAEDVPGWNRTIYLNNEQDHTVKTIELDKTSGSIIITPADIKDFLNNKPPLFVYTTSLPKDKAKAATMRVRRIFVCKITWN